jgi:hypothetical protein
MVNASDWGQPGRVKSFNRRAEMRKAFTVKAAVRSTAPGQ